MQMGYSLKGKENSGRFSNLRESAVSEEFLIFLEILDSWNCPFTWSIFWFCNGHISHYHHLFWFHLPFADPFKLVPRKINWQMMPLLQPPGTSLARSVERFSKIWGGGCLCTRPTSRPGLVVLRKGKRKWPAQKPLSPHCKAGIHVFLSLTEK